MARGSYPLEAWVETIPFENLVEDGLERLRRQEGLKILVDMSAVRSAAGSAGFEDQRTVQRTRLWRHRHGRRSGLGLGLAEAMAENGAKVTVLDVDAARVEAESRRLQGWATECAVRYVDVSDHAALTRHSMRRMPLMAGSTSSSPMPASIPVRAS